MSLVGKQLPALFNGVSQQPATQRLPSQAEEATNCSFSVVDGCTKRPPAENVRKLTNDYLGSAYLHTINRDSTERYIVAISSGDIKVYGLDGLPRNVYFPGRGNWIGSTEYATVGDTVLPTTPNGFLYRVVTEGTTGVTEPTWPTELGETVDDGGVTWQCVPDYLFTGNAQADFAAVTVADFTFIVNKQIVCAMMEPGEDEKIPSSTYYSINETVKKKGLYAKSLKKIKTAVQAQYPANPTGPVYKGEVQAFEKLPATATDGDIYKIKGTADSNFTAYYVRRNGGVWDETVAPNLSNRIFELTMPHALVRREDGDFEFAPFSWAPRRVGDEDTNPNPTFIGRQIRDVFFHKNRLGFCVDENVVMSRAGDFGNFYRLTVLDLLDDAMIDVAASTAQVTKFNYAMPFPGQMMLFSDQTQFILSDNGALTPSTVSLELATSYETVPGVRPLQLGTDAYFVTETGDYAKLREYYVREGENGTEAADTSAHVPKYIPAGVIDIFGSTDNDSIGVITSGDPHSLYLYQWYWSSETEKAQSAWSKWTFDSDATLLAGNFIDSYMYLVVERYDGTYLERFSLEEGAVTGVLPFRVHLDRLDEVTGYYLAGEGKTQYTLPYPVPAGARSSFRLVYATGGVAGAAITVDPTDYEWVSSTVVKLLGDGSGDCYCGYAYEMRYTFSEQFLNAQAGVPVLTGRLQLRTFTVYFTDTGYFQTEVAPHGNDGDVEVIVPSKFAEFTARTLGNSALVLNAPTFETGSYSFQIYGDSKAAVVSLVNDSHVGSTFQSAEWEGFYHTRVSRFV